jgi:hypothetical protein
MLFILIPIVWLGVITMFVALCRMAALGDAPRASDSNASHRWIGHRVSVFGRYLAPMRGARRSVRHMDSPHPSRPAIARRRITAHGIR